MNEVLDKNDQTFLSGSRRNDHEANIGDFFYDLKPTRDAGIGLTEQTVDYIVHVKGASEWMGEYLNNAFRVFLSPPLPTHCAGAELQEINFDLLRYYLASGDATKRTWDEVPDGIKEAF